MGVADNGDMEKRRVDDDSYNRPGGLCLISAICLRIVCLVLSLAGLIVMAKDKELAVITEAQESVYILAKFSYIRAFVFLIYANGIVALYGFFLAIVLTLGFFTKAGIGKPLSWLLFIFDQSLAYVLLSAASASAEVAYLAKRGDEKVTWSPVCSYFHHFCDRIGVSLVLSFLSVVVMAVLSIMSAQHLFRKYSRVR